LQEFQVKREKWGNNAKDGQMKGAYAGERTSYAAVTKQASGKGKDAPL